MLPLSELTGSDAMGTGGLVGAIFESVEEEVEGADRGGVEGVKASDASESGGMAEGLGPSGDGLFSHQEHEEESTEDADGIPGFSTSGGGGVEGSEEGSGRFEVESEEGECGLKPLVGEVARPSPKPSDQVVGEGLDVVGMVGGHRDSPGSRVE